MATDRRGRRRRHKRHKARASYCRFMNATLAQMIAVIATPSPAMQWLLHNEAARYLEQGKQHGN